MSEFLQAEAFQRWAWDEGKILSLLCTWQSEFSWKWFKDKNLQHVIHCIDSQQSSTSTQWELPFQLKYSLYFFFLNSFEVLKTYPAWVCTGVDVLCSLTVCVTSQTCREAVQLFFHVFFFSLSLKLSAHWKMLECCSDGYRWQRVGRVNRNVPSLLQPICVTTAESFDWEWMQIALLAPKTREPHVGVVCLSSVTEALLSQQNSSEGVCVET